MRKRKYLLLPSIFLLFLITGCGGVTKEEVAEEKREYIDFQYLNFEALDNLGTYPHDKLADKTYENFIEKNEDNFVRWTAPVMEVFPITDIIRLGVEGLPKIHAEFDYDITETDEKELKKGTILTVSCRPHDYIHGLGGRPTWDIRNCRIEETKEKEQADLMAYKEQLKGKKSELAKVEAENAEKQKEQEAKEQEQKAIEAAKLEEYAKTPEGKKESLAKAVHKAIGKKSGEKDSIVEIEFNENDWFVTLNSSWGWSDNSTRNGILRDSGKIFKEVFTDKMDINSIHIKWLGDLVDVKGHEFEAPIITLEMTKSNAKSINWDNFDYANFPIVADSYWEHEVLNK